MFKILNIKNQILKLGKVFIKPRINYQPLIEVRIFKNEILNNLEVFKKTYTKFQFAPVLKSNAYGHGLVEVAKMLDSKGVPFFMVDSFFEALTLRQAFINTKVLILGFVRPEEILKNQLKNISYGIIDLEILKNLSANAYKAISIHLKVDTGMHRQGILIEQIDEAINLIKQNKNLILEGVCSHLADADGEMSDYTHQQILKWNNLVTKLKNEISDIKYFHLSNTIGSGFEKEINANVSRLGIGLYGFAAGYVHSQLKPALEMRSIITSIKTISVGEKVGYNITYTATRETKVATVPVGYNEGLDRRLSSIGFVKIKETDCPIVGRISMNMSSVDVTEVKEVKLEDEVIIISKNRNDKNSVENIAKQSGQIPYEVLVKIPGNLKRVIY